jgi:FkbM family methyltransferase
MEAEVATLAGVQLGLGQHIAPRIAETMQRGSYEDHELAALEGLLRPGDIVMELGAGLGFLSCYCASRLGSERVFAYEANPLLESHIRSNFSKNGVAPTLTIAALGPRCGEADFYIRNEFWASSLCSEPPFRHKVKTPVLAFGDELSRVRPTLLVVDIEGGEYELLTQAELRGVDGLVLEMHEPARAGADLELIRSLLRQGLVFDEQLSADGVLAFRRGTDGRWPEAHIAAVLPWNAYRALLEDIAALPPGDEFVLVDENLLWDLNSELAMFLNAENSRDFRMAYEDADALRLLKTRCEEGARWLVIARSSRWILDEFGQFSAFVQQHGVRSDSGAAIKFNLADVPRARPRA